MERFTDEQMAALGINREAVSDLLRRAEERAMDALFAADPAAVVHVAFAPETRAALKMGISAGMAGLFDVLRREGSLTPGVYHQGTPGD